MNFRKSFQKREVGFQMAPMIDVVFLLLIFFMVSSIFAEWETKVGIEVPTSQTGAQSIRQPNEIMINVDGEGRYFVNSIEMSLLRIEGLLKIIGEEHKSPPVIIRADRKTHHEKVIGLLDICRKVDIWNVSFATLPEENQP